MDIIHIYIYHDHVWILLSNECTHSAEPSPQVLTCDRETRMITDK